MIIWLWSLLVAYFAYVHGALVVASLLRSFAARENSYWMGMAAKIHGTKVAVRKSTYCTALRGPPSCAVLQPRPNDDVFHIHLGIYGGLTCDSFLLLIKSRNNRRKRTDARRSAEWISTFSVRLKLVAWKQVEGSYYICTVGVRVAPTRIVFIMAQHLANIFGTEKDRVNCPFYFKIGYVRAFLYFWLIEGHIHKNKKDWAVFTRHSEGAEANQSACVVGHVCTASVRTFLTVFSSLQSMSTWR